MRVVIFGVCMLAAGCGRIGFDSGSGADTDANVGVPLDANVPVDAVPDPDACVPMAEVANLLDDNCNGLVDDCIVPLSVNDDLATGGDAGDIGCPLTLGQRYFGHGSVEADEDMDCFAFVAGPETLNAHNMSTVPPDAQELPLRGDAIWALSLRGPDDFLIEQIMGQTSLPTLGGGSAVGGSAYWDETLTGGNYQYCIQRVSGTGRFQYYFSLLSQNFSLAEDDVALDLDAGDNAGEPTAYGVLPDPGLISSYGGFGIGDTEDCYALNAGIVQAKPFGGSHDVKLVIYDGPGASERYNETILSGAVSSLVPVVDGEVACVVRVAGDDVQLYQVNLPN